MSTMFEKTQFPGVRRRPHKTRKHGIGPDYYFAIRFRKGDKIQEEACGWASEGWTAAKAYSRLAELKEAYRQGQGPTSLKEKRLQAQAQAAQEALEKAQNDKESTTFGAFVVSSYLPESKQEKKPRTYATEQGLFRNHLEPVLGHLPMSEVSSFHLQKIKKDMSRKGKSARTLQYAFQMVRHVFSKATVKGYYNGPAPKDGIFKDVSWPRVDNMKDRVLSLEEAEALLTALAARSRTMHDMALLSLHTGLRFQECARLSWSDISLVEGFLMVRNSKNKASNRKVYLTTRVKVMLEGRGPGQPDALVFPKKGGKPGPMEFVSKVFADAVNSLGLNQGRTDRKSRFGFHGLRHCYATNLYAVTQDIYITQRSLGHSTPIMTQRYARMSDKRLQEGAQALEKVFSSTTKKERSINE